MSNLVSKSVALIEHRSFSECYFMRVFGIGPRFQVLLGDFDGDINVALFIAELVAEIRAGTGVKFASTAFF